MIALVVRYAGRRRPARTGRTASAGQKERGRHQPEHDRQSERLPGRGDDRAVQARPERSDAERQREVEGERRVTDRRRRDVGEERLELRALGEAEQAHDENARPKSGDARPDQQEQHEPDRASDVGADDHRLPPETVRQPAGEERHRDRQDDERAVHHVRRGGRQTRGRSVRYSSAKRLTTPSPRPPPPSTDAR